MAYATSVNCIRNQGCGVEHGKPSCHCVSQFSLTPLPCGTVPLSYTIESATSAAKRARD
jgi:hypothetical protein